jgi:catalase
VRLLLSCPRSDPRTLTLQVCPFPVSLSSSIYADPVGQLWQKVYKDDAKDRFIETVSGHMSTVRDKKIVARMMTIFSEVDADLGARLEKATGVQKAGDIATMKFNGTHNGWNKDSKIPANGMKSGGEVNFNNGAPQTAEA